MGGYQLSGETSHPSSGGKEAACERHGHGSEVAAVTRLGDSGKHQSVKGEELPRRLKSRTRPSPEVTECGLRNRSSLKIQGEMAMADPKAPS